MYCRFNSYFTKEKLHFSRICSFYCCLVKKGGALSQQFAIRGLVAYEKISLFHLIILRPATLIKKRLQHRCFPVNFVKFLRTLFLTEHVWQLLLQQETPEFRKPISTFCVGLQVTFCGGRLLMGSSKIFRVHFISRLG